MLKRVSIQNFKSLKDVTLDLQKVNLLIGPNNSGKTNFLKALEYFGKHHTTIAEEPDRNKISYAHNVLNSINIQFKFDAKNQEYDIRYYTYYVFECQINPNGSVVREKWYQDLTQPSVKTFDASEKSFSYEDLHEIVGPLIIYKPDPNRLDKPGPVGIGEELVSADASNLVGFLDLMLGKYRRTVFSRIETDIHTCIPEFDEVNLDDAEPKEGLKKQFGDKSFKRLGLYNSQQGITYWADELSEGTLYFLALLCIINQPNPPKLLLLEEPEKGIHPRRIWEVMKFIFQLAEEKDVQIIMTTHNEHVVNAFSSMPESIFVFDKDEETGATTVRNLQKGIIEPSHQKSEELGLDKIDFTGNLGDNWLYGLIGGVPANDL